MRICELLAGLPTVTILGVGDLVPTAAITVHIETRIGQPERCPSHAETATTKDPARVLLSDPREIIKWNMSLPIVTESRSV